MCGYRRQRSRRPRATSASIARGIAESSRKSGSDRGAVDLGRAVTRTLVIASDLGILRAAVTRSCQVRLKGEWKFLRCASASPRRMDCRRSHHTPEM